MPGAKTVPTQQPRYVEIQPLTGWQTMSKTVREIDEDRVEACKDDINTLLVFAGLYSAVLSAFNIESYSSLQPDSNAEMIYLLRQIAIQMQSYTVTSGSMINSTVLLSHTPPTFAAPLWALRVNGLWFASLIVSLATASLSMLVKQWLREYLAIEYTAPQERLRAHQYRKPGLEKWKVFEIAAVLPMLLQLSLGLFFIGLCVFTANIDERMGLTSIPLVSGWAFFLITTVLAPLLSPRCPYKMPLLKSTMRLLRVWLTIPIRQRLTLLASRVRYSALRPDPTQQTLASTKTFDEEDEVVAGDQDDTDILLATDAAMADDNLLRTIWETFNQRRHDAEDCFKFVVELIIHRLGRQADYLRQPVLRRIPDLTKLSRRGWDTFMEILAEVAGQRQSGGALVISSPDWLFNITILFLSTSPHSLPASAQSCLRDLLDSSGRGFEFQALSRKVATTDGDEPSTFQFYPISSPLNQLYKNTSLKPPSLYTTYEFYWQLLQPHCTRKDSFSLSILLSQDPTLFDSSRSGLRAILDDVWDVTVAAILSDLRDDEREVIGFSEGISVLVAYAIHGGKQEEASRIVAELMRSVPNGPRTIRVVFTSLSQQTYFSFAQRLKFLMDAYAASDSQAVIPAAIMAVMLRLATMEENSKPSMESIVRWCLVCLSMYTETRKIGVKPTVSRDPTSVTAKAHVIGSFLGWSGVWPACASALRSYHVKEGWKIPEDFNFQGPKDLRTTSEQVLEEDCTFAGQCLDIIARLDDGSHPACEIRPPRAPLPDELVSALGLFIPSGDMSKYPRLARLSKEPKSAPTSEDANDSDDLDKLLTDTKDVPSALKSLMLRSMRDLMQMQSGAVRIGMDGTGRNLGVETGTGRAEVHNNGDEMALGSSRTGRESASVNKDEQPINSTSIRPAEANKGPQAPTPSARYYDTGSQDEGRPAATGSRHTNKIKECRTSGLEEAGSCGSGDSGHIATDGCSGVAADSRYQESADGDGNSTDSPSNVKSGTQGDASSPGRASGSPNDTIVLNDGEIASRGPTHSAAEDINIVPAGSSVPANGTRSVDDGARSRLDQPNISAAPSMSSAIVGEAVQHDHRQRENKGSNTRSG